MCRIEEELENAGTPEAPQSVTMQPASARPAEISLDPANPEEWDEFAAEAHHILDDTLAQLRTLRGCPAWQPMPPTVRQAIHDAPAPLGERSLDAVYAELASRVLPYTSANRHPRAWGWVRGQGTPVAMIADLIASAANAYVGSGNSAPIELEETVLRWLAEALEMRAPGATGITAPSGLLTSGATMANLLGLAVARNAMAGYNIRDEGLSGRPRMVVYASTETHGWAQKAMELLGFGSRSLRLVAADADGQLSLPALREQLARDRAAGLAPIAVIANAGTVNTGAFDDLRAIRDFCHQEKLWMHVDGAIGALLKLSPRHRALVAGMETADSVAFDLHKWMYLPFETGCLLVRDSETHHAAFRTEAAYMERTARGMLSGDVSFSDRGIEQTRGFKALRVWMQLSVHGLNKHARLIEQNMAQAAHLERLILDHPELERLADRRANIVCFRYVLAASATSDELNAVNREIVLALQETGRFIVSGTTLASGAFAIRVANTNHRSRLEDFDALVTAVIEHGRALVVSRPPANLL
jgi:aromatic-L-amino-acid decarboxylase